MADKKFYGMKNDYMFKAVLQKSNEVLKNLVSVLLDIDEKEIFSCEITNTIELGKAIDAKDCILDVKVTLNNSEIIDLELQVKNEHNWPERSLLYWSRAYDSLKEGEDYRQLRKTYHIGILDFTLFDENPSFYAEYVIQDKDTGYQYSDKLNIRILDLTRIEEVERETMTDPRSDEVENETIKQEKLIKWAKVFKATTLKELEEIAGDEEVFKDMVSQIKMLSADEKIRQQLQARDDYERRMIGQYNRGNMDGLAKGEEIGLAKGEEIGLAKGEEIGLAKGQEIGREELLVTMVKDGILSVEKAAEYMGMGTEEFEKLITNN